MSKTIDIASWKATPGTWAELTSTPRADIEAFIASGTERMRVLDELMHQPCDGAIGIGGIVGALGLGPRSVRAALDRLCEIGFAERVTEGRRVRWRATVDAIAWRRRKLGRPS